MTRKEFAFAVGLTASYVRHVETGRRALRVSQAILWSHVFGCDATPLVNAVLQDQVTAAGAALVVRIEEGNGR